MFRVRIESEAKNNLRKHYQALRSRNPDSEYPEHWYYGIRAAIRDLAHSAAQCGLAYEDRYFADAIRQGLFDAYKILFVLRDDTVHVLQPRVQKT
jgi:hypothetical protein